jgi:hypothetical protein
MPCLFRQRIYTDDLINRKMMRELDRPVAAPLRTFSASLAVFLLIAGVAVGADLKISGEVLGQGAPCVQFLTDSGETVSLDGASPQDFKRGMRFEISGTWMRISTCMQGRAFRVLEYKEVQ